MQLTYQQLKHVQGWKNLIDLSQKKKKKKNFVAFGSEKKVPDPSFHAPPLKIKWRTPYYCWVLTQYLNGLL